MSRRDTYDPSNPRVACDVNEVARLHSLGTPTATIASLVGVSHSTIVRRLNNLGLRPHSQSHAMHRWYDKLSIEERKKLTRAARIASKTRKSRYADKITITLIDAELVSKINKARGREPMNKWIRRAITQFLNTPPIS